MPKLEYTLTWEKPKPNPIRTLGDITLGILVFFAILILSYLFFADSAPLRIAYGGDKFTAAQPPNVHDAYFALLIWVFFGAAMFFGALMLNYILAPWTRWRKTYLPDESYSITTYECGENPIGEGRHQTNLQYYSFAVVFVIFDVITAFVLIFSLVYFNLLSRFEALLAFLFFTMFPLLLLGFWIHKKTILWQ